MEEKKHNKDDEKQKSSEIVIKIPSMPKIPQRVWMVSAVFFFFVSLILLVQPGTIGMFSLGGSSTEQAANKAVAWIDDYYKSSGSGTTVTLLSSEYESDTGLVSFQIKISGPQGEQTQTLYASRDGSLFLPQAISTEITQDSGQTNEQAQLDIPKTDIPEVELYVMSYCPYGNIAEEAMKPVVDLLGNKMDIKVRYIVSVSGETVNSLHGTKEANQDIREACIQRDYDLGVFWDFLEYTNSNCDLNNIDTCWIEAADAVGIDVEKVQGCFDSDGLSFMQSDNALTTENGVSGSPTLMINGVKVSVARTPESYKQAICGAFNNEPDECSQQLSGDASAASSGGC